MKALKRILILSQSDETRHSLTVVLPREKHRAGVPRSNPSVSAKLIIDISSSSKMRPKRLAVGIFCCAAGFLMPLCQWRLMQRDV